MIAGLPPEPPRANSCLYDIIGRCQLTTETPALAVWRRSHKVMATWHWKTRSIDRLLDLFALLPLPALHTLGWLTGQLLYLIPNRARLIAAINIELCFPHQSVAQQHRMLRRTLVETSKTVLEMGPAFKLPAENLINKWVTGIHGQEHLHAADSRGNGLILLAPHFGCWELLNLWVAKHRSLTALYRPPRQPYVEPILLAGRTRNGAHMLPADSQGVRGLIRSLRAGETVGILPDQEPSGAEHFASFFGVPAKTMTLVCRIANKSQATVLFACARRLPRAQGFELHFIPTEPQIADSDSHTAIAALNRGVESCVNLAPEQYQWTYKRFYTHPDGRRHYPSKRRKKGRKRR